VYLLCTFAVSLCSGLWHLSDLPLNADVVVRVRVWFTGFSLPSLYHSTRQATAQELIDSDKKGAERALEIKAAMRHAWTGYKKQAWGFDEIGPMTGTAKDSWGGESDAAGLTCVNPF
jgi:hypothetical protein